MKHNSQILSQSACQNPVRHQLWDYYAIATERTICPDLCFGLEDVTLHPNTLERQGNRMVSSCIILSRNRLSWDYSTQHFATFRSTYHHLTFP